MKHRQNKVGMEREWGSEKRKESERDIRKRRMDLWLGWRRRGKNEIFNCS